jgi:hypothetical protein
MLYLEVPEPKYSPTGSSQIGVDSSISGFVRGDLLIPEWPGLPAVVIRMAMPERPVDKDGNAPAAEDEIRAPGNVAGIEAPSSHACCPQRAAQCELWCGVLVPDAAHQSASCSWGEAICHIGADVELGRS